MDYLELNKALNGFGKYVIQQSRSNLTKGKKNSTSDLYNSLKYDITEEQGNFLLDFLMEDYGDFVDQGVRGAGSSSNNRTSPFKFGSGTGKKGGLTKGIEKWIKQKPIKQWKDKKTGKFLSYKSMKFLIARSIYNKGTKPSLFFTKPFYSAFKRLPVEIVKAFKLDIEKAIVLGTKR
tara:strand:- start:42 stop:572 length:531 start_codon:yes stop_codon:yes gene_type:complete